MKPVIYLPQPGSTNPSHALTVAVNNTETVSAPKFIEANTVEVSSWELKHQHIIPTYIDSEMLISHSEFIEVTEAVVGDFFRHERILSPSIRVSHPVLGRIPEAKDKPTSELREWERTRFFERCMFVIEIPSINDTIDGQSLSMTIGGVRVYEGMHQRKGGDEYFKVFAGFKVRVCSNLSVWADGFTGEIRVKNLQQLEQEIRKLVEGYDAVSDLAQMDRLQHYSLTESQFAQLLGRCRMYQYLPTIQKKAIPELKFGDSQINSVCKDYYRDKSFCRAADGDINLWRVLNLFTEANKGSYIDTFLPRAVNASQLINGLAYSLEHRCSNWFLS